MDTDYLSMPPRGKPNMGTACFYLPTQIISEMLNPNVFRGSEVWCLYPTTIYEMIEPNEFHDFVNNFFFVNKSKAFSSCVQSELCCVLFRPHLMSKDDFEVIRLALTFFDEDKLCFGYGKSCLP
ncbi:MAG: hypothetical protein J6K42_06700 [Clostridia bacterium]|nr:hypothetical protein [Clostridia bacterium]